MSKKKSTKTATKAAEKKTENGAVETSRKGIYRRTN